MMTIRFAKTSDAQAIADIWNHYIRETIATFNAAEKSTADVKSMLIQKADENHPVFCAQCDGRVIGFATYGAFRAGVGYAHSKEHTVMLAPDASKLGYGGALMRSLENHCRENGVHCLMAGVSAENTVGIRFHEKIGFSAVATLPEVGYKFSRWHDLVLMQKILSK
ncbi:N-acetyltransferase [Amylibacter ulvae]|uniref:N-acetyltransferase n=1 Tax=Paramylibacter ulvae TaxID=1651968 RepID=A0ABQ3D5U7_9RHOB|nr:GNAT family N-acetyltransferase [Amylibacter ulvae]GHA54394.1 N-acetyltransferase [Amylibacter ulvae]